jgi:hypothetical protein
LLKDGKLLGLYLKPSAIVPEEKRLTTMFVQAEAMAQIPRTNQDLFGNLNYVMASYQYLDIWVFKASYGTLLLGITEPYDHKVLADDAKQFISKHEEKNGQYIRQYGNS